MLTQPQATLLGIFIQAAGAAWLVLQAYLTARKLRDFSSRLTFKEFGEAVALLARELASQFWQQLIGFLLVVLGSALQIYGAWS